MHEKMSSKRTLQHCKIFFDNKGNNFLMKETHKKQGNSSKHETLNYQ